MNKTMKSSITLLSLTLLMTSVFADAGKVDAAKDILTDKAETKSADAYFKKPAWLSEASITVKQGYDSNVFAVDHGSLANMSSWYTSITPKVSLNFVPFLELGKDDKSVETLNLSYAPEVVEYYDTSTENHTNHRIGTVAKGKVDQFSYNVDNAFNYVDGEDTGVINLPAGEVSAYAVAYTRERKEQFYNKNSSFVRYDFDDHWFVRPTFFMLWQDRREVMGTATGYPNYPDRWDINGGTDIGYKIDKDYAVTLGYRFGHQNQGEVPTAPGVFYSSDYQRVLFGIEGKPLPWMKINLQAGPEFRVYMNGVQSTFDQSNKNTYYLDANIAFEVTSKDTITISSRDNQWVSGTGLSTYFDRAEQISYTRKITDALSGNISFRALESDYDAPTMRDDWVFGYGCGLKYVLDEHWTFFADYTYDRGQNDYDAISSSREFARHVALLGVKWSL